MSQLIKVKVGDMQIWMEPDETALTEAGIRKVAAAEAAAELAQAAETLGSPL